MQKANIDVRNAAKKNGLPLWIIANALGIHEVTLVKKLRVELPVKEKQLLLSIIDKISEYDKVGLENENT